MSQAKAFLAQSVKTPLVGIVVAMPQEVKALTSLKCSFQQPRMLTPGLLVCLSGIGYENATRAASHLIASGATALMSFGTAAALDPQLLPGDIIFPEAIIHQQQYFAIDKDFKATLQAYFDKAHLKEYLEYKNRNYISSGYITAANIFLQNAEQKAELFAATAAYAADMESLAIAQFAAEHEIPFTILRVISDRANFNFPEAVSMAISNKGKFNYFLFFWRLLNKPKELAQVKFLMRDFKQAKHSLKLLASVLKLIRYT